MNDIFHALRSDMRRAFGSWSFLIAVVGTSTMLFFGLFTESVGQAESVLNAYHIAEGASFKSLNLIFCAVPYATCFCSDWTNNYVRPSVMRTSPKCYAVSKSIACACAGGAALFLGKLIFVLSFIVRAPMAPTNVSEIIEQIGGGYQNLLVQHRYFLFLLLLLFVESLQGTFCSLLALYFSTWIPNLFVVLFIPLLAFYFVMNLFSGVLKVPGWLRIENIFTSYFTFGGILTTFLYQIFFALIICIIFTLLFVRGVKRRLSDG